MNKRNISLILLAAGLGIFALSRFGAVEPKFSAATVEPQAASVRKSNPPINSPTEKPAVETAAKTGASTGGDLLVNCRRILALKVGKEDNRKAEMDTFLAGLSSESDLLAVLSCIGEAGEAGSQFSYAWTAFWKHLTSTNRALAIQCMEALPVDHCWYREAAEELVEGWAKNDPQGAVQWLGQNHKITGDAITLVVKKLIRGYAENDPVQAALYASKIFDPSEKDFRNVTFDISKAAFVNGGEAGLRAWFEAIPPEYKRSYFGSVGNRLGSKNEALQQQWLEEHVASPYRLNSAYENFIKSRATTNPQAAVEFGLSITPHVTDGTTVSIRPAVEVWLSDDSSGLTGYLQKLSDGPNKAAITSEIALQVQNGKTFAIRRAAQQVSQALNSK